MNKFSKRLAFALVACAAAGAAACQEQNKPEEKAAASTPAPAQTTEAAPAPEAKPEAAATPAAEPEKKAEAPAAPAPAQPEQVAQAEPAAAPAADAAAPAEEAPPGSRKPDGDAVFPNPVSELAKSEGIKFEDGRYRNKDGDPVPVVTKDYTVDWGTWNGFRRYHDACHVCHGPNALGSTFAPSLADSLKTMDYNTFIGTVSSGRVVNRAGTEYVMPAFGEDKNIMCYIDDIYTYIKARSQNSIDSHTGMPAGRPNGREDISPEAKKAAEECTG
ncbi:c-type cytochrome, methanol metabolism-related [Hyphomicrobium sp. ghe19]|uniref:c-type cytochrome, methanol metabolism-related n=1 Tax=Hyphomicrobium sp. ghe19 TaxID=2682968 RepID=UPI001366B4EB|nr:Cytochrome c-553I [Hyphomicrobium sp. ghe19]